MAAKANTVVSEGTCLHRTGKLFKLIFGLGGLCLLVASGLFGYTLSARELAIENGTKIGSIVEHQDQAVARFDDLMKEQREIGKSVAGIERELKHLNGRVNK